jgi:hypothetical protein
MRHIKVFGVFPLISFLTSMLMGCTSSEIGANRNPIISKFTLVPETSRTLAARFFWEFSEPDGDPVRCTLADGESEVLVLPTAMCLATLKDPAPVVIEAVYKQSGTYTASLKLEDGVGGIAIATATVTVR